jgi:hypothetical protein
MQRGASLHMSFGRDGRSWMLSDGDCISDAVALLVLAHPSVVGVGDSLFAGSSSQTFRYLAVEKEARA